jgi:hypothetical protein
MTRVYRHQREQYVVERVVGAGVVNLQRDVQ